MVYKELFPVVVAAAPWGFHWSSKQVEFSSDNTSMIEVLRSGTSHDPNLNALLRHLFVLAACHSFLFTATHVAGKLNLVADALPRFNFQKIRCLVPYAAPEAKAIPVDLFPAASVTQPVLLLQLNGYTPWLKSSFLGFATRIVVLRASQQVLMRFFSHLGDCLHHSSTIKVYLSGIHSLHIDVGFSDPLANCLQLQ